MADPAESAPIPWDPSVDWTRWSSVALGRVPPEWLSALRADPLLRRARVVVDLVFGGELRVTAHAGPEPLSSASRDGRRVRAAPDLLEEPELEERLEVGQAAPQGRSISVQVPGRIVRAPSLLAAGRQVEAHGEVSLIVDGMTWENRLVFLRGPTTGGIQVAREDEDAELTVSDPQAQTRQIPAWILDATRFPELPANASGDRVPLIVGSARGTPCPRVASSVGGGTDDFLVGYGDLNVTRQWIQGASTSSGSELQTTDARGLPVTILRYVAGASDDFATINATCRERGAYQDRTVVDVVRRLLTMFGLLDATRLSDRMFAEAAVREPNTGIEDGGRVSPRCCVNRPVPALNYVTENLLVDYPWCTLAWDGSGLGPVVVDFRLEPVAVLTVGQYPLAQRPDGARYEVGAVEDLVTSVAVRYDYDPVADAYEGVEVRDTETSTICATAARIIDGDSPAEDIDGLTIGNQATAAFTADWIVEHRSRQHLDVVVEAYPVCWLTLRLGDPVRFSDPEAPLTDEQAVVIGRKWSSGLVELTIRVWPRAWGDVGGGSVAYPSARG